MTAKRFVAALAKLGYTPHTPTSCRGTAYRIANDTSGLPAIVIKLL